MAWLTQSTKPSAGGHEASAYDDTSAAAADSTSTDLSRLTPLQRRIYQAIAAEAPDWPEGVDVAQILARNKSTDPAQVQYVLYLTAGTPSTSWPTTAISIKPATRRIT